MCFISSRRDWKPRRAIGDIDKCMARTITQEVTFHGFTASMYDGPLKTLVQNSYGSALGIYDASTKTWSTDCSVNSTAVTDGTRRAHHLHAHVTFVATVSMQKSTVAAQLASLLTAGDFNSQMAAVQAGDTNLASVTLPTATSVRAPTSTSSSSGDDSSSDSTTVIIIVACCVAGVILLICIATCLSRQAKHTPTDSITVHKDDLGNERLGPPVEDNTPVDDKTIQI